jgi:hypothetical protein
MTTRKVVFLLSRLDPGIRLSLIKLGPLGAYAGDLEPCVACGKGFRYGDVTTFIACGPGDDVRERKRAAAGQEFRAVALRGHWECITGEKP